MLSCGSDNVVGSGQKLLPIFIPRIYILDNLHVIETGTCTSSSFVRLLPEFKTPSPLLNLREWSSWNYGPKLPISFLYSVSLLFVIWRTICLGGVGYESWVQEIGNEFD